MSPHHLQSGFIDPISLGLNEDVYGANGDLSEFEIEDRLIENIHHQTGFQYHDSGTLPINVVARLIRSVWEDKDRDYMEALEGSYFAAYPPPPPRQAEHSTVVPFKKPER